MLTILLFGLIAGVMGATKIFAWAESFGGQSRDDPWTWSRAICSASVGVSLGCGVGYCIACGIGLFVPSHMIVTQAFTLEPNHARYVSVYQRRPAYFSFATKVNGVTKPQSIQGYLLVEIYQEDRSDGRLVKFERAFKSKDTTDCNFFACPIGMERYEFHIPKNTIGTL